MQSIGERLEYALKMRNMSNYALSKNTGVSQSTIGSIIKNGRKVYNRSTITSICNYLGVSEDWLRDNIGDMAGTDVAVDFKKQRELIKPDDNLTPPSKQFSDMELRSDIEQKNLLIAYQQKEIELLKKELESLRKEANQNLGRADHLKNT